MSSGTLDLGTSLSFEPSDMDLLIERLEPAVLSQQKRDGSHEIGERRIGERTNKDERTHPWTV
jgi:hypothetical protein